ncbi:unnamed protein product, partial [Adineta steineri]
MGSKSSTQQQIIKYVETESDESKRMKVLFDLTNQSAALKNEVLSQPQLILDGILETVMDHGDVLVLKYSNLTNMEEIKKNVADIFGKFPLLNVIADTATQLIATMNNTKELTELIKWHQRTIKKLVGDKVFGLEMHYK